MNTLVNKNISTLIINVDGLMCNKVSLGKSVRDSLINVKQNHKLAEAIDSLLYHGFKIIWISSSATSDVKHTISSILGNVHEKTPIIGHELLTSKCEPYFYERLIHETLKTKNIAPHETILISNRKLNGDGLSANKALHATLTANSPEELAQWLKYINWCYLLN